jgi:pilus assembly protein CpaB
MRAFTISVDATTGVSGFLRPGDRVDVYWSGTVEEGGRAARQVTQLIESGLVIVGIDQTADESQTTIGVARTVTVEVTPQQVAKLALAQRTGGLSLSLVGYGDEVATDAIEIDQKALLGLEDAPAPAAAPQAAPAPKVCTVRTRRGAEVIETPVDCPGEDTTPFSGLTNPDTIPPEPVAEAPVETAESDVTAEAPPNEQVAVDGASSSSN